MPCTLSHSCCLFYLQQRLLLVFADNRSTDLSLFLEWLFTYSWQVCIVQLRLVCAIHHVLSFYKYLDTGVPYQHIVNCVLPRR